MVRLNSRKQASIDERVGLRRTLELAIAYQVQMALEAMALNNDDICMGWLAEAMSTWSLAETVFPGQGEQIYLRGQQLGKDRYEVCFVVYGNEQKTEFGTL